MKREQSEAVDCKDCPVREQLGERLTKIDEIHSALFGILNQPQLGIVSRLSRLEEFKKQMERNHYLQIGFMIGAGVAGGGIGSLITKLVL